MIKAIVFAITLLAFSIGYSASAECGSQPKPVLLMGINYGVYERQTWIQSILSPSKMDFVSSDAWVDPGIGAGWTPYSAVMIADSSPGTITSATAAAVQSYVNSGGVVFLEEGALTTTFGILQKGTVPAWVSSLLGANKTNYIFSSTGAYHLSYTASDIVAPWPTDVIPLFADPLKWGPQFATLTELTTAKALASTATDSVLTINRIGSGAVIAMGRTLFRIKGITGSDASNLQQAIIETLQNIGVASPGTIDLSQLRADTGTPTANFIPWRRDPLHDDAFDSVLQIGFGPRWSPIYPVQAEVLSSLAADVGKNDYTSVPFNVFSFNDLTASVSVITTLPAGSVEIVATTPLKSPGTGNPDRSQTDFWLKSLGTSGTAPLTGRQNKLFFLRVNAAAMPDITVKTTYNLTLAISDGVTSKVVPVTITRYPLTLSFNYAPREGFYTLYVMGSDPFTFNTLSGNPPNLVPLNYTFNPTNPTAGPILDAAKFMGFRSMNISLDVNAVTILTGPSAGKTLAQVVPGQFLLPDGSVPSLNFSNLDNRVNAAVSRGAFRVQVRNSETDKTIQNLTGIAWTPTLDPTWKSTFVGIWGQFKTYLQSKGFNEFVYKFQDEDTQVKLEQQWIPMSQAIQGAGWAAEANLSGAAINATVINEVLPTIGSLQINANWTDDVIARLKAGEFAVPSNVLLPIYGSWGYYKSPSNFTREQWWQLFKKSPFIGIEIYNFENLQVFDGTTEFLAASAQGWTDGWYDHAWLRYLAALYNASSSVGWKATVTDFFANSIATDPSNPPASPYYHGMFWQAVPINGSYPARTDLVATTKQLEASRHDAFELITASFLPTLSVAPPSVPPSGQITSTWDNIQSPTTTDWIGIYLPGASNVNKTDWYYTNSCNRFHGTQLVPSGSCAHAMPATPGTYEFRLFTNNTYTKLATSTPVTVTGP